MGDRGSCFFSIMDELCYFLFEITMFSCLEGMFVCENK